MSPRQVRGEGRAAKKAAPYGSWRSPVGPEDIGKVLVLPSEIAVDGEDAYVLVPTPELGGRGVLYRVSPDGAATRLVSPPFNARTTVHEYGGGAFLAHRGTVFFSNFDDQRVYRLEPGAQPKPVTPQGPRYADYAWDEKRKRLIAVREVHQADGREAVNTLAELRPLGGEGPDLVWGNDFYSSPAVSPDGSRLAWLTWNHPNMPWDGTELWVGELREDGSVGRSARVAGGRGESVFQPQWSPSGELYFVSDRTGWWNIYRVAEGRARALHPMEAEFGVAQWSLGLSTYSFASPELIFCCFKRNGFFTAAKLETESGRLTPLRTPYTGIRSVKVMDGAALFVGDSPTEPGCVVRLDLRTGATGALFSPSRKRLDPVSISIPRHITFPTAGGKEAHGFLYLPKNGSYRGPKGERPPLVVASHGGPTGSTNSSLDPRVQFWTSRGFAVLDVNYRGSTGYGREYRRALYGRWGYADVEDCEAGARFLARSGKVDPKRLIIRGGSAGGYTTLCALAFGSTFKAGGSYFAVADPDTLEKGTHKFESHYLYSLIPSRRSRWRSALKSASRIKRPVIFFQGLEDRIVPPQQSEEMFQAVKRNGVPVAYLAFEGEQHGFRRAETMKRAWEAELYFYSEVLGFDLPEKVEPVPIANLATA